MKTSQFLALFLCLFLIIVCGITNAGEKILVNVEVPLPDDIKITAPAEDVPKGLAAFSGAWEGKWSPSDREAALIVEEINSKEAKIIYSEGKQSGTHHWPSGYERYKAVVTPDDQHIEFSPAEKTSVIFRMENNLNQISGTYEFPMGTSEIIMTKIK